MSTSTLLGGNSATTTGAAKTDNVQATTSLQAAETSAAVGTEPSSGGLDAGAIVGIVVGALCCVLLLAALVAFVARRRGQGEETPSADTVTLDNFGESKNLKSEYAAFTAVPDTTAAIEYSGLPSVTAHVIYDTAVQPASGNYGAAPTFE
jgi:hypothetical protein